MNLLQEKTSDQYSLNVSVNPDGCGNVFLCEQGYPAAEPEQRLGHLLRSTSSVANMLCETPLAMVSQLKGRFDCCANGTAPALESNADERRQWWQFAGQAGVVCSNVDFSFCESACRTPERITEVNSPGIANHFEWRGIAEKEYAGLCYYAATPMCDAQGDLLGTLCVLDRKPRRLRPHQRNGLHLLAQQFIAQLEMHRELLHLQSQALTDPLTNVGNRRGFERRLREECSRRLRNGEALSLLMIDVDRFKQYNDTYGHPAGDAALTMLCELLRMPLRNTDFVARIGGDEFVILLPDTSEAGAHLVADRIQSMLKSAQWPHRPLSVSTGVATLPPGEIGDVGALLQLADQTMYSCKRSRRKSR